MRDGDRARVARRDAGWTGRLLRASGFVLAFAAAACGGSADAGPTCEGAACGRGDAGPTDAQTSGPDACPEGHCAPDSCPALIAAGQCPAHRICETTSAGPVCLEGCEAGYEYDRATSTCAPCSTADCAPVPTCEDGNGAGVAGECAAAHRTCEDQPNGAVCGDCLDGFRREGESCVDEKLCGDRECTADEMAVREGGSCTCRPRRCTDGEAERADGTCRPCDISCAGDGETGRAYPKTDDSGACVCEPKPGFFWPLGDAAQALPCDEDHDGWITDTAYKAYSATDSTIRAIAQASCELKQVDRVVLKNEYGQELSVWSCDDGLDVACTGAIAALPLVEPDRNDSDGKLAEARDDVPSIGAGGAGRTPLASELNAVTKACATALADFDDDGSPDLAQAQLQEPEGLLERWSAFSYFMELHRSYYRPASALSALGSFVIEERSRCDGSFPMGYQSTDSDYWLQCARRRDARFDADQPAPGFDFAGWSCRDPNTDQPIAQGSCPVPVPPVQPRPGVSDAPPHGLCDLLGAWDQKWRGMHHHSQFKCVLVSEESVPHAVSIQDVRGNDAYLDFQRCQLRAGDDFACSQFLATANAVGWAAVRYETQRRLPTLDGLFPVSEVAGCIDEAQEWTGLCPDDNPDHVGTVFKSADADDFGHLVCGCGDLERDYYADADGDRFGDPSRSTRACEKPDGFVTDNTDCNDADPAVNPGFADSPDAQNLDSNCDGIDGDLVRSVFVAASHGNDARTGRAPGQAVRTLARGLELALACAPAACDVLVAEGEYPQPRTLRLTNGVSLYGGYSSAFARNRDASAVRVFGAVNPLVLADRIDRATTVDRVTLVGTNRTGAGDESVTVLVLDSATPDRLSFTNDIIQAGNGGPGSTGGNAGAVQCHAAGGNGATSVDCGSNQGGRGSAGGSTVRAGVGGAGGANYCLDACPLLGGSGVSNGNDGSRGGDGAHAASAPAADGDADGFFVGDDWRPGGGPSGHAGENGTGGGGGGSGGTKRFANCFGCGSLIGGNGGAGGNGGCGGGGGGGGGQGGASIGVVLYNSTVSLAGTRIQRGIGGTGGTGGSGSVGNDGTGGSSGGGTVHGCCAAACYNAGGGGAGGAGGKGGSGSGGTGGNGGPALGVAIVGNSSLSQAPSVDGGQGGAGGGGGAGAPGSVLGQGGVTGDLAATRQF